MNVFVCVYIYIIVRDNFVRLTSGLCEKIASLIVNWVASFSN